jgi:hypothetical protein
VIALTQTQDYGLRTLSGGQYSIQVEGFLAIDQAAAPDIVVDSARSVRDVYAVLKSPPLGSPVTLQVKRDGILMCSLTIPAGATVSSAVDGMALGPLPAGARLSLEVTGVGQEHPGADLTVVIRL